MASKRRPFSAIGSHAQAAAAMVAGATWSGDANVAFGRVISKVPTKVSPSLQEGEDLRFTFEGPGADVDQEKPYWCTRSRTTARFPPACSHHERHKSLEPALPAAKRMQGDTSFETEEALALRAALKHDTRVRTELLKFWRVYDRDQDGHVSKAEYLNVHAKLCLVLIPDITPEEARRAGEEDWVSDAHGEANMSQEHLFDCVFELADMWCTGISAEEYAAFLRKLFKRVTVKSVTRSNGTVVTAAPIAPSKVCAVCVQRNMQCTWCS